jgi:cytochrome c oxidase assembly protein subunit 11
MADSTSIKRLVMRLLLLVVVMFAFGFALVPIYDVMCKAFGINGKTAGQYEGAQVVDPGGRCGCSFWSTNAMGMVWEFYPKGDQLVVNPAAVNEMVFVASNPTDHPMSAQAVPSISPAEAAQYFHKTECFCFTQQVLQAGRAHRNAHALHCRSRHAQGCETPDAGLHAVRYHCAPSARCRCWQGRSPASPIRRTLHGNS